MEGNKQTAAASQQREPQTDKRDGADVRDGVAYEMMQ